MLHKHFWISSTVIYRNPPQMPLLLYSPNHLKIFFDVAVLSGSCQSMVK